MIHLVKLAAFTTWMAELRDKQARDRINARLLRVQRGTLGDVKPVGQGVSELRVDYGPGYRVYIKQLGTEIVVLLCGGDKRTQDADIRQALQLAQTLED